MSLKTFFFPVAVIITVILVIWVIIPKWEIIKESKKELDKKEDAVKSLNLKRDRIGQSVEIYNKNAMEADVIYKALPSKIDNDSFVDEIFKGAKNRGVLITNLKLEKIQLVDDKKAASLVDDITGEIEDQDVVVRTPTLFKVPFSLELVGDYLGTKDFVNFMESANRLFTIKSIQMSQAEESASTIGTSISGTLFYKKEDPNLLISSIVYTNDPVLESLTSETGRLDIDFISSYKGNLVNSGYSFSPDIMGIGKEDLFSQSGGGEAIAPETAGNEITELTEVTGGVGQ